MISFKDYMEKYHSGYYDEYIKYTEDNKERERERVILKSLSSDNFDYAINIQGSPSLYNWTTFYKDASWGGYYYDYIPLNLFEDNQNSNSLFKLFARFEGWQRNSFIRCSKDPNDVVSTDKSNNGKFRIVEGSEWDGRASFGGEFNGFSSFRPCVFCKEMIINES